MGTRKITFTQQKIFFKKYKFLILILLLCVGVFFKSIQNKKNGSFCEIVVPIKHQDYFEPSGAIYSSLLKGHLIISDDTKKDKPYLFLLKDREMIDVGSIPVEGAKKIEDMESITIGDKGEIYILSSGSTNKHGDREKKRERVLKIKQTATGLKQVSSFILEDAVRDLLKTKLRRVKNIEIEGAFVRNDNLYLGLRKPAIRNKLMILKIENLNKSFENKSLSSEQVSLWREFALPPGEVTKEGISDLLFKDDQLFIATAFNKKKGGRIFTHKLKEKSSLKEIIYFDDLQPEAISYDPGTNQLLILFDNNKQSKMKHPIYLHNY